MTLSQGAGAGLGLTLGGILSAILKKYAGYDLTIGDAAAIMGAATGVGGVAFHALARYGLLPLLGWALHGPPKQAAGTTTVTVTHPPGA